jgi:perosamine synthetase
LRQIADEHDIALVADACHALGGAYKNRPVGSLADMSVFSFHPVKHITTGEGGMVTTDDPVLAERMRIFRNHGITADHAQRRREGTWFYEMVDLGYNYRITDLQCALGLSQLSRLKSWIARRQMIAQRYDTALADLNGLEPLGRQARVSHAYHLYVIRVNRDSCRLNRAEVFTLFREQGIGVNVHYIPVHLHPYYRNRFGYGPGDCPVAEAAYEELISLPMFAAMSDDDVERVIEIATRAVAA